VNYKVYETKDVNAFAMANGCIRVYSGLMDMMNDNEVEAVIGHEMGHVALGHVKKGMQVALGTNAVRRGRLGGRYRRQPVAVSAWRSGRNW
jgi:putative metalloprotease